MDCNKPGIKDDPGDAGVTADCENSESEKEKGRCSSEDLTSSASWSQRSLSQSLQRAETLLRSTFNPNLKWLFNCRSQDEDVEEGNFVVAPNLVSRSSARLLHLQHALLTVAPQWQHIGVSQVCVKGLQTEGGVVYLPSSTCSLQGHYGALWKLLEERSLLLFTHEYIRRVCLTKSFISRVRHLLEGHINKSHLNQALTSLSSGQVSLGSLSQELRVHLNHWSCLFSKVQSDNYLKHALVHKSWLLVDTKRTLDLLSLQAMTLMEKYVHVVLSATAQADLNTVLPEVLEDIVTGIDVLNQAVEEQRAQRCGTQRRSVVLQRAHYNKMNYSLPTNTAHHPAAFSVKELTVVFAAHHAEKIAKKLHCWASKQSLQLCPLHNIQKTCKCSDKSLNSIWSPAQSPEWTSSSVKCVYHCPTLHFISSQRNSFESPCCTCDLNSDATIVENHYLGPSSSTSSRFRSKKPDKAQTSQDHTCRWHLGVSRSRKDALHTVNSTFERLSDSENHKLLHTFSFCSTPSNNCSALLLSDMCQQDRSSAELFFQVLVSSSDLLAPLMSLTPTPEAPPKHTLPKTLTETCLPSGNNRSVSLIASKLKTAEPEESTAPTTELTKEKKTDETWEKCAEPEKATSSLGSHRKGDPQSIGAGGQQMEQDCVRCPASVKWLDLGQSLVYDDLLEQYSSLLRTLGSKAVRLQLRVPHTGNAVGSANLRDNQWVYQILQQISQALDTDLVQKDSRPILEDLSQYLLVITSHAQWDYELCRSLGSALRDKCVIDVSRSSCSLLSSHTQDGRLATSATMEHFLRLSTPLLSSLHFHHSHRRASDHLMPICSSLALQRQTMSLVLATVQLSTVWVMFKAYQFLSSWTLSKFLLITQGDLKALRECLEVIVHHIKSLMMNSNDQHHSALHNHSQLQLRQQLDALDTAVCELQTFSSLVLKTFSRDCKRVSREIFEQTMPSAVHWRPSNRTGLPISPSEYASLAAQTVIGQVLESTAPLPEDSRFQAISITVTAFLEAWMEHILKQKIKFSVQGALQLKQDFDSVRDIIQSDEYSLSAEIHQQLLSLRVFQQVDSAVVCLLQQPQAKPYLQSRARNFFTCCCPSSSSSSSSCSRRVVGSSITNLRCVEGEDLSQTDPSAITSNFYSVDPSSPGEPYLAPSVDLGAAQQEWLNLRIHSSVRRWRLSGLQEFPKCEH